MGWLLWGLSRDPLLRQELILKGGSALRKLYFPDTRFSDDLDFTTRRNVSGATFRDRLGSLQETVAKASGIVFEAEKTRVEEKQTPDPEVNALDGRVYFRGLAGDSSMTFRVKFDVSPYERVVLPLQEHRIIHGFPDAHVCAASVLGYSLEEILAEKLRSWIQRTRARDLFDVAKIIQSERLPVSKLNILSAFMQKTVFKDMPVVGRSELLEDGKFEAVKINWLDTIICPSHAIIAAANAVTIFIQFVTALFQPEVTGALAAHAVMPRSGYRCRISSVIREAIITAGQARNLIRMVYDNRERNVEPYSFKYKVRKSDGMGFEYFFGFDRTRGQHIKQFFLHEIQNVSILPEQFQPRYPVEF